MLKGIFGLPLRALEGFINSVFELIDVELKSPDYTGNQVKGLWRT